MGRPHTPSSVGIQLFPMSVLKGIAFRANVWTGPNHTNSKAARTEVYGEKGVSLRMDTLRKLYTVVAENIRKAREKQPRQEATPSKIQVNDLVLVKDPESAVFEPRYMPNYRVTAIFGRNRIEVQDEKGNKSVRHAAHVKVCQPVDKVINQLPPQTVYEQYGRT